MHVNIKRLLSFLVVLAMVLSMTPVTGIPAIEAKAETAATTTTPSYADDLVFEADGKTAFCPKCNKPVEWTAYTGQYATTTRSDTSAVVTDHFYLSEDLEFKSQFALKTYENTHFHLNGHNIKALPLDTTAWQRVFDCSQEFDLMGTGVVYGGNKAQYNNSGMIMVVSHTLRVHSGTLQHAEGFTPGSVNNLLQIGASAGKIVIEGGTLNVPAGKLAIYAMGESATKDNVAVVEISGGTVNGNVQIGSESYNAARLNDASLTFTGGAVNGTIYSDCQAPITIGRTASAAGIDIPADSKLTVKEGWSGSAKVAFAAGLTDGKVPAANGVAEGDFTGNLVNNKVKLVNNGGVLTQSDSAFGFNDKAPLNYCEHCDKVVAWTALNEGENTDGTANHYYVAADMTAGKGNLIHGSKYQETNVCLQLNGMTLTTGATDTTSNYKPSVYGSNQADISIMGEGTVINGGTNKLFVTETCTLNLYGGTYISSATQAASIQNTNSKVNLFNKAKIVGATTISNGVLALNDEASIEGLTITGGTVTAEEGWTGHLENANNRYLELNSEGTWVEMNQTPVWGEFNPKACGGKAYCEICGKDAGPVLWTAKKGNDRIDYKTDGGHHHYYLTGDLNMPTTTSQLAGAETNTTICVNLNGYNINQTGRVYIGTGCTISFFGDGNVTFTGDTTATHQTQDYTNAGFYFAGATATLNLFGGTYSVAGQAAEDGKPMVLGSGNLNIKNATVNGTIKNSKVKLEGSAIAEDINIVAGGKVTIAEGWSGTANLTVPAGAFTNGVLAAGSAEGDFDGTLTCNGVELSYVDGALKADTTFVPGAASNYCEACGEFVKWEELPTTWSSVYPTGSHYHYYLPADTSNTAGNLFQTSNQITKPEWYTKADAGNIFCLYLNGYTLNLTGQILVGSNGAVNIFGGGTVKTAGANIFNTYSGTLNLYGGEYIASANGKAITIAGGTTVNVYDNANLQGDVVVPQGAVNVYDEAVLSNIDISGGKTTFKTGWSGSAVVNAAQSLITDNTIDSTKAYVEDNISGTIKSVAGFKADVVNHAIVLNNPEPGVFNPGAYNGYAHCPECGKLVQWIDYNAHVEANGFYHNNAGLDVSGTTATFHFYLSDNLAYTKNVLTTNEDITFNLNGFDVYPVAEKDAATITASYAFSSTQKMALINTAEKMSTVTGWSTNAGTGTVLYQGGGNATSHAYIYGNITLKTADGCTTDAPVVQVGPNGGRMYLKGGIIDGSNKTNTRFPTAVYVGGQAKNSSDKPSVGEFYLESGEIKGGKATNGAGTIRVGTDSTGANYVDGACFYMTGGKISGGDGTDGGNIYAGTQAAEISITGGIITGGIAKNGGNIYSNGADLTIGGDAVISNGFLPFTDNTNASGGGGNIWFGNGTLTIDGGTITGGKIEKFKGAGGNIYLNNGAYGEVHFIMNGGEIKGGQIPVGDEAIYEGADPAGQNYGANIRAYNIQEMKLLGGTIEGGIGGDPEKAKGRDVYLSCYDIETVLTIGSITINGAIHLGDHKLILKDAPVITAADGKNGLSFGDGADVLADISGLTAGAAVQLSGVTPNAPFTVACDNVETLKNYITVIDSDATLTTQNNQLILIGVAIMGGEEIEWYADNAAAVAAYLADSTSYATGKYIQLGLDTNLVLTEGEYLIDLAGNVAGEVAITGTGIVHLFDSANLDFEGFRTATVADTVTLAERDHTVIVDEEAVRFIIVTDADGKTSAHLLSMAVNGVNLNTEKVGLSYNAEYKCDEYLAKKISAYGMILSLKDMPGTEMNSSDKRTVLTNFTLDEKYTVTSTSSSVTGILKDTRTPEKNAEYGKMKIYANAYIELDLDGDDAADILVADNEHVGQQAGNAWSLYDVLFEIDQNWAEHASEQEAAKAFYENWFDLGMSEYADDFTNIDVKPDAEGGEAEAVTPEDTDIDNPIEKT